MRTPNDNPYERIEDLIAEPDFPMKEDQRLHAFEVEDFMMECIHSIPFSKSIGGLLIYNLYRLDIPIWKTQRYISPEKEGWEAVNVSYHIPGRLFFIHAPDSILGNEVKRDIYQKKTYHQMLDMILDRVINEKYQIWKKKKNLKT